MRPTRNSKRSPDLSDVMAQQERAARAMRRSRSRSTTPSKNTTTNNKGSSPSSANTGTGGGGVYPDAVKSSSQSQSHEKNKKKASSSISNEKAINVTAKKSPSKTTAKKKLSVASVSSKQPSLAKNKTKNNNAADSYNEETATDYAANETETMESKNRNHRAAKKPPPSSSVAAAAAGSGKRKAAPDEDSRKSTSRGRSQRSRSPNGHKGEKSLIEEDMQSPVAEITFTTTTHETDGAGNHFLPKKKKKKKAHNNNAAPPDLDEPTLEAVKEYLSQNNLIHGKLQEDELNQFMIRINRVSGQQAAYQHHLVGDSDDSEASLYMEIKAEEEEHAIGHDLHKTMVSDIRRDKKDLELDSKTLGWIKRAAGLHRSQAESVARQHAIETDTSRILMKTRTATRRSRAQKRERGVKVLAEALDELEQELGGFVVVADTSSSRSNSGRKKPPSRPNKNNATPPHQAAAAAADTGKRGEKRKSPATTTTTTALVARFLKRRMFNTGTTLQSVHDVTVSRVVVGGRLINGDSSRRPMRQSAVEPKGDQHQVNGPPEPSPERNSDSMHPSIPNMNVLEFARRQATSLFGNEDNPRLMDPKFRKQVQDGRSADLKQAGIVCRLPQWDTVNEGVSRALCPPRSRHSNVVYASFCLQLMNSLSGAARSWAVNEFFYSDLDRAWYNRNKFIEEAAKLGINPDARLTSSEWKAVRRRISSKPRRFSKRFIATQMSERNEYRNSVRMLHRAPVLGGMYNVPYDVPAPIRIGKKVTAYSRRFKILQRGIVLSYDEATARYLVLFDDEEFGSEYCPDSEVASQGGPEILIPATSSFVSAPDYLAPGSATAIPCGTTKKGPVADKDRRPSVTLRNELQQALHFTPLNLPPSLAKVAIGNIESQQSSFGSSAAGLRDVVAEREMLTLLLSFAETASKRKAMLLDAMEEANTRQADKLPFGEEEFASSAEPPAQFQGHYGWLQANLDETNQALRTAMYYLRSMYGSAYLPSKPREQFCSPRQVVNNGLNAIISERMPPPKAAMDWASILATQASGIGDGLASLLCPKVTCSGSEQVNKSRAGMRNRLGPVGGLFLAASCCQAMAAAPSSTDHEPSLAALQALSHELRAVPEMPVAVKDADDLYCAARQERDLALGDLQDALHLFATEIAVSSTRNELINQAS